MRRPIGAIICAMAVACAAGCMPDAAHVAVSLPPPYDSLPPASPGAPIEAGAAVTLDARQQEAVVVGVTRWLKDPASAQFGTMRGVRNSRGIVTVCGYVDGRNSRGVHVGMKPFVGALMGTRARPDFVVVGIGGSEREEAEVASLCRESGITQAG